jgi:hypothetical protein
MYKLFILQADKFSRKRKAPTPRTAPVSKKVLFEVADTLLSLHDTSPGPSHATENPTVVLPTNTGAFDQPTVDQVIIFN